MARWCRRKIPKQSLEIFRHVYGTYYTEIFIYTIIWLYLMMSYSHSSILVQSNIKPNFACLFQSGLSIEPQFAGLFFSYKALIFEFFLSSLLWSCILSYLFSSIFVNKTCHVGPRSNPSTQSCSNIWAELSAPWGRINLWSLIIF